MAGYPISHSMADTYMSCQKKFEYSFVEKLMPAIAPEALARGIWGHRVLENFFNSIKDGESVDKAKSVALLNAMDEPKYFNKFWNRIERFIDVEYPKLGWIEVLAVEDKNNVDVSSEYRFPFTVDLVVRVERNSERWVEAIDFKFGADAYSDEIVGLFPQLPKYIGGLNLLQQNGTLGYDAPSRASYVFIRSRTNIANPDLFVEIKSVSITTTRIRNSFIEQDRASRAILDHLAVEGRPFPRAFTNNCKYCPFNELCIAELNGRPAEDIETMKEVLFTKNSYDYTEEAD